MRLPPELVELLFALLPDLRFLPVPWQARIASPWPNSIGLIVQPGPRGPLQFARTLTTNPVEFFANLWGHTAMYVRVGGRIVEVIGFDPDRFLMFRDFLGTGRAVSSGRRATPGVVYSEEGMFRSPDALFVEFQLDRDTARGLARALPNPGMAGLAGPLPQFYVTRGGANLLAVPPGVFGNCIDFIRTFLAQRQLGLQLNLAPIGPSQGLVTRALLARDDVRLVAPSGGLVPPRIRHLRPSNLVRALRREQNFLRSMGALRIVCSFGRGAHRMIIQHTGTLWFDPLPTLQPLYGALAAYAPSLGDALDGGLLGGQLGTLVEWVEQNTDLALLTPWLEPTLIDYLFFAGLISEFLLAALPETYRRTRAGALFVHSVTATLAWVAAILTLLYGQGVALQTVLPLLTLLAVMLGTG